MTKIYLLVPPIAGKNTLTPEYQQTNIKSLLPQNALEVGDKLLRVYSKSGEYKGVLPSVETIVYLNHDQNLLTIETEKTYTREIPVSLIKTILNRDLSIGSTEISPSEFTAITDYMAETPSEENGLLAHISRYIAAKGYYFDEETLYNYHICLKTRPFVILAGLSGTGKSKLSQFYAEAMGHTRRNERYLRLAVRPDWSDDRFLLGYLNTITGEYIAEPALDFLLRAKNDGNNLYFFCLDEMNLAHVEYYFSQFLSALEEEDPLDRLIPLLSETTWNRIEKSGKTVGITPSLIIPPNVLFCGTINVDETTQTLSDKVIDRANTIEFFTVNFEKLPEPTPLPEPISISSTCWQNYITHQRDITQRLIITEIGKILNKVDLGFGYRVLHDIEVYLSNSHNILSLQTALDLQVKQRILPHVRGTNFIEPGIDELIVFMRQHGFNRSEIRLNEMKEKLKRDGYTNFWR